jgi:hypothetical protein
MGLLSESVKNSNKYARQNKVNCVFVRLYINDNHDCSLIK